MSDSPLLGEEPCPGPSTQHDIKKNSLVENGIHADENLLLAPSLSELEIEELSDSMLELIIEVSILEEVFSEHREASIMERFGGVQWPEPSTSTAAEPPPTGRKQYEVRCQECQRSIAATRYAPHLDKCIGMGRNSSRVAHRKLQQAQEAEPSSNSHSDDELLAPSDDDVDWQTKRKRKKRNGKGKGAKKSRSAQPKSGDS